MQSRMLQREDRSVAENIAVSSLHSIGSDDDLVTYVGAFGYTFGRKPDQCANAFSAPLW